ncbi:MAG: hypothetical protein J7K54_01345 [Candidatus Aenigmarchaeota archaeon]|nr:hypothetical protein [Candidatus Aenigmarchaeota archaeon]
MTERGIFYIKSSGFPNLRENVSIESISILECDYDMHRYGGKIELDNSRGKILRDWNAAPSSDPEMIGEAITSALVEFDGDNLQV